MFAVCGAYWLFASVLRGLEVDARWLPYGMYAIAALVGGGVMIAHAPLRPWREPAAAGVLAVASMAVLSLVRPDRKLNWFLADVLQPWYAGLGIAVASGVLAAAGGLAVRRVTAAAPGTARTLLLSALVCLGLVGTALLAAYATTGWMTAVLVSCAVGGFVTQAAVASRQIWTCGAGGGVLAAFSLAYDGDLSAGMIAITVLAGLIVLLLGTVGARLAWQLLHGGEPPSGPDLPPAQLG